MGGFYGRVIGRAMGRRLHENRQTYIVAIRERRAITNTEPGDPSINAAAIRTLVA
jgi:hypothetical protein